MARALKKGKICRLRDTTATLIRIEKKKKKKKKNNSEKCLFNDYNLTRKKFWQNIFFYSFERVATLVDFHWSWLKPKLVILLQWYFLSWYYLFFERAMVLHQYLTYLVKFSNISSFLSLYIHKCKGLFQNIKSNLIA